MALTKYNWNSFDVTPVASKALGFNSGADGLTSIAGTNLVLIKTLTASADSDLSFVDGTDDVVLDNTYPIYKFEFINIHPATNDTSFTFQANAASQSGYNETITSTHWKAYQTESGATNEFAYETSNDQTQATGYQILKEGLGGDNDQCAAGYLYLFDPSSTTFVKHFIARMNANRHNDSSKDSWCAGYINTTGAINDIQFKETSGNIDAGTIKLYGLADS